MVLSLAACSFPESRQSVRPETQVFPVGRVTLKVLRRKPIRSVFQIVGMVGLEMATLGHRWERSTALSLDAILGHLASSRKPKMERPRR
jgi:hypothetical protein